MGKENNLPSTAYRAGSAEELAESADFQLLPEDEYLAEVIAMEFVPKEDQKASQYGPAQDQYKASLRIHSFSDGSDLEDTKGEPVQEFTIVTWINPARIGMVPQPARARKFFAACLRQPVAQAIEIENFPDDLIGKQLYVSTINAKTDKGEWTRAQDFRPIKIERNRRTAVETSQPQDGPTSDADSDGDEITF